ncbi:acyclic terpene utilization AtuA family protein [Kineothrix sedimenti]|uniref:Acyclic terpene utilization AtuA family protein n=1 Tax=Kineothrix sedimenti TaxID=3123317 RepID=A0ABZ3EX75_9FIRM
MSKKVKIGGGQGFWGDSNDAAIHMVRHSDIDYLGCDYLAELTLSIMQRQKLKNPAMGYARDFVGLVKEIGKEAYEKNIKILTDAGGMNIDGCVKEVSETLKEQGVEKFKIGYVTGDDMLARIPEMMKQGIGFQNMDDVGDFNEIKDKIVNANVYYGHEPILECLNQEADMVITGRATDSALFLSPMMYEFGWAPDDYDNLARGIMTGHLLECGGQGAGGNYMYDWKSVPRMDELGFPIVELSDNEMYITKAPDCGGIICEQSCKEQFLYEVLDPANYLTPDVNVDISHATLTNAGDNRVKVEGIKGKKRPDTVKLCIGYHAGYKVATYLSFAWPDAYEKAQYTADILMKKMKRKGLVAEEIRIDYLGVNALHLGVANMNPEMLKNMNEVVLRIAIRTKEKAEAAKIIPEISPLQLNGPPGASFFGGRAKVQEVIGLWPTLIPRDTLQLHSHILEVK